VSKKQKDQITIFIVEDNEMYSLMLDHRLKNLGNYRIVSYTTGKECLDNLYQNPDLIILDYSLDEDMSGIDVLQEIKSTDEELPVIMLSGQSELNVVVDSFKEGAADYVIKDENTIEYLFNSINQILERKKLEDENITLKIKVSKYKVLATLFLFIIFGLALIVVATVIKGDDLF